MKQSTTVLLRLFLPYFYPLAREKILNYMLIRTWREFARYKGAELAMQEGEKPLFRLAWLMEEIFEMLNEAKRFPQFKAEN